MGGITIPIRGNTASLRAEIRELTSVIRQLSKDINSAFKPAAQAATKAAAATKEVSAAAQKSRKGFREMGAAALGALTAVAGVAGALGTLATSMPQIIRVGRVIAMSLRGPIEAAGKQVATFGAKLKTLAGNPTFRKIAIGAVAAAAAIAGTVVAVKVTMAAFHRLRSAASGVLRGIATAARATATTIKSAFSGLRGMMPSLGGGGAGMLGGMAGIVGIGAAIALVTSQLKGAFTAAAAFEDLRVRVESFTGSAEAAKALLTEMSRFADVTPFESGDMHELLAILLGSGIRDNVAQIAKDLAAVARNRQQLGEIGDALAKGFAKGKFQTEELNKFLERGINLMPQFAAVTGLAGDELTKAIEKGLAFDVVTEAIARMSRKGGQFFGILARQALTFRGLWSTLMSAFNDARKAFAMPVLESLKPALQDAITLVESLREKAAAFGKAMGEGLLRVYAIIKNGDGLQLLGTGLRVAFHSAVDILMRGLHSAVGFLAAALPPIFEGLTAKLRDPQMWEGVMWMVRGIGKLFAAEIRAALPGANMQELEMQREKAGIMSEIGKLKIGAAGNVDLGKVIGDALISGAFGAIDAAKAYPESPELKAAKEALQKMLEAAEATAKALRENATVPPPEKGATGQGTGSRADTGLAGIVKEALTLTTSLGRIGGGGFGMTMVPMVDEQKKTNRTLKDIEKNTRGGGSGASFVATYA